MFARHLLAATFAVVLTPQLYAQDADYKRDKDVVYGRRGKTDLTMDVFTPKKAANKAGVILCVSGDFKSGRGLLDAVHPLATRELLKRGYVVFAVTHISQPTCSVPEIVDDVHRSVRFVKANAANYGVRPDRLGMAGASSGGCLSLLMGCAGRAGDPKAADPVDRESSKVAAVACFFPVTDFLAFEANPPKGFDGLFPFHERDPLTGKVVKITAERRREIGKLCSPLHCATRDAVPTFIIHGDADELVPLKQSELLIDKLRKYKVECSLDVKPGMGHSALAASVHLPQLANWFDKYLAK
ncbi:MAG TPA: alpha/beta hydrolase [Gemmata sp.]|nr:alpha/beta hydrolase [Gemmata sp.]